MPKTTVLFNQLFRVEMTVQVYICVSGFAEQFRNLKILLMSHLDDYCSEFSWEGDHESANRFALGGWVWRL